MYVSMVTRLFERLFQRLGALMDQNERVRNSFFARRGMVLVRRHRARIEQRTHGQVRLVQSTGYLNGRSEMDARSDDQAARSFKHHGPRPNHTTQDGRLMRCRSIV
jgi:hypothetical protein